MSPLPPSKQDHLCIFFMLSLVIIFQYKEQILLLPIHVNTNSNYYSSWDTLFFTSRKNKSSILHSHNYYYLGLVSRKHHTSSSMTWGFRTPHFRNLFVQQRLSPAFTGTSFSWYCQSPRTVFVLSSPCITKYYVKQWLAIRFSTQRWKRLLISHCS